MAYLKRKDHWVQRAFTTCNFSLVLQGGGEFNRGGQRWEVAAPCVITQWPGVYVEYGPSPPIRSWDELYLIYSADRMSAFRNCGFVDDSRPVWPIHNVEAVHETIKMLRALDASGNPAEAVDRIDRLAEQLLLETLLPGPSFSGDSTDAWLRPLLLHLHQRPGDHYDFDQFARKHGMSPSTFRRRWIESRKVPPARYMLNLRIQEARRLLVETALPIGTIASRTGFDDRLYFSRRFKLETGLAASQYRRRYRMNNPG